MVGYAWMKLVDSIFSSETTLTHPTTEGHSVTICSIGTIAASFELRSVSDVFTLRTCGAAVSSATKSWNVLRLGATHLRMKSISPESIQHSRTKGSPRTKFSNALRSASDWLDRCTMANTVTS